MNATFPEKIRRMVREIGKANLTPANVTAWLQSQPYSDAVELVEEIAEIDKHELQRMVDAVGDPSVN